MSSVRCPSLGRHYQRREAQKNVPKTKPTATDATAVIPMTVALARVVRVVVPESETIPAGSMLVASHGHMATDSAPRRSERVTQQPARLLHAVEVYVAPSTPLRNVGCERKAVTAGLRAIGLEDNGAQFLISSMAHAFW